MTEDQLPLMLFYTRFHSVQVADEEIHAASRCIA